MRKLFTYINENFQGTYTLCGGDVYFEKSVKINNYFLEAMDENFIN